jgi:hypothetical protein
MNTSNTLQRKIEEIHFSYKEDISLLQKKLGEVYRDTLNATQEMTSRHFDFQN